MAAVMDYFRSCWGARSRAGRRGKKGSDAAGRQDGLLWYKDAGQAATGDFSMAVVQANNLLEDQSQVESGSLSMADPGPQGTFVGVYAGHGGPETSRFINANMFPHLRSKPHLKKNPHLLISATKKKQENLLTTFALLLC